MTYHDQCSQLSMVLILTTAIGVYSGTHIHQMVTLIPSEDGIGKILTVIHIEPSTILVLMDNTMEVKNRYF